ncbi:MAG: polyprenol monophosphomannose synthase [Cytophagales bacterium]|nr:polyprenol monophosphomannose synthase [Cytophagales bacterium]
MPLVIIPTYNERENIVSLIKAIFSLSTNFHLLIVDDASPDGTAQIVKKLISTYPDRLHLICREEKWGLGTAYVEGFKFALKNGYDYILQMDADFSHDPKDLVRLYNTCKAENYDLVIGSRYISGVNVVNWPIGRVLLSYFASFFVRFITGLPIMDTTAGFKCYTKEVLETIDLDKIQFIGYGFQVEMLFLAWKYGFKLKEIPIVFTDRVRGVSKMSKSIISEAVFGIIKMKISSFFKKYHRR